jgi:hypothetical protein
MRTRSRVVLSALLLAAVVVALVVWINARHATALTQPYHNIALGLSLRLPADYTVTETTSTNPPEQNGPAEIVEFSDGQGNIQLEVSPASYVSSPLTVASILSNYPSVGRDTVQPFPIAPSTVGLAIDDDQTHPGEVSDVWFARGGHLYQFTAFGDGYKELIPVAKTISLQ